MVYRQQRARFERLLFFSVIFCVIGLREGARDEVFHFGALLHACAVPYLHVTEAEWFSVGGD